MSLRDHSHRPLQCLLDLRHEALQGLATLTELHEGNLSGHRRRITCCVLQSDMRQLKTITNHPHTPYLQKKKKGPSTKMLNKKEGLHGIKFSESNETLSDPSESGPLSRDRRSNTAVAQCFSGYHKLSLLYPLLARQQGTIAANGALPGRRCRILLGCLVGIAIPLGYRARLDRKSQHSGQTRNRRIKHTNCMGLASEEGT